MPVYIGPILLFAAGWPLIVRIVRLAKSQNLTSVADFLAARYGKSPAVAGIVTLVAVVGTLPYIALQLKAVVTSTEVLLGNSPLIPFALPEVGILETAFVVALALALFAVLFGTRHIDATEHQDGLMLAVATELLVKLAAFLTVGVFVVYSVFGGIMVSPSMPGKCQVRDGVRPALQWRRLADGDIPELRVRDFAAAAIPRHRGRKPLRARNQAGRMDVPALPRADQSVRRADRRRRPADPAARAGRSRHVRARAADVEGGRYRHHTRLYRRTFGGHGHGDRRIGRAVDHDLQRPGGASAPSASACSIPTSTRSWPGGC